MCLCALCIGCLDSCAHTLCLYYNYGISHEMTRFRHPFQLNSLTIYFTSLVNSFECCIWAAFNNVNEMRFAQMHKHILHIFWLNWLPYIAFICYNFDAFQFKMSNAEWNYSWSVKPNEAALAVYHLLSPQFLSKYLNKLYYYFVSRNKRIAYIHFSYDIAFAGNTMGWLPTEFFFHLYI